MKKFHIIYKTTCLVTGKWYIGMHSTDDVNDKYLGSGKVLIRSLKKHGRQNHVREILLHADTREELRILEKQIVTPELVADRMCMNTVIGGIGGTLGHPERVLSGFIKHSKRLHEDDEYRESFKEKLSRAGKIGGARGAEARMRNQLSDPAKREEHSRRMSEAISKHWIKRKAIKAEEGRMSPLNATPMESQNAQ